MLSLILNRNVLADHCGLNEVTRGHSVSSKTVVSRDAINKNWNFFNIVFRSIETVESKQVLSLNYKILYISKNFKSSFLIGSPSRKFAIIAPRNWTLHTYERSQVFQTNKRVEKGKIMRSLNYYPVDHLHSSTIACVHLNYSKGFHETKQKNYTVFKIHSKTAGNN